MNKGLLAISVENLSLKSHSKEQQQLESNSFEEVVNNDFTLPMARIPGGQTTEVGSFPANTFGLYDMHGNVWE